MCTKLGKIFFSSGLGIFFTAYNLKYKNEKSYSLKYKSVRDLECSKSSPHTYLFVTDIRNTADIALKTAINFNISVLDKERNKMCSYAHFGNSYGYC